MRPPDDDLVGAGEARLRREDGPGVAHRDVVAEEAADPRDRGGEVDGAEDEHPRLRRVRRDEDPHPLTAPLPVGTVGEDRRASLREKPSRVVAHGVVRSPAAERADAPRSSVVRAARRSSGCTTTRRPTHAGSGCSMTVTTATGRPARDVGGDLAELGERLAGDLLDEDVEDAPAGQPHGIRVVVADAVALEHRRGRTRRPPGPARRRRPRRSRPRPTRRPRRRGRRASRRRPGAAPSATCRRRCRRRRSRRPTTTASARPSPHARATTSISSSNAASECPATKSSMCGRAATIPCCTGS